MSAVVAEQSCNAQPQDRSYSQNARAWSVSVPESVQRKAITGNVPDADREQKNVETDIRNIQCFISILRPII